MRSASRVLTFVEIIIVFFVFIYLVFIWTADIAVETQFIPTILNGVVSSISLIVGFTITVVAIMFKSKLTPSSLRILLTGFALLVSIAMVLLAYVELMSYAYYELALKLAMVGLVISFATIGDLLSFFHYALTTKELSREPE